MGRNPTQLTSEHQQTLAAILPLLAQANRAAVAAVRAQRPTTGRLGQAGKALMLRSGRTAAAHPWLSLGLTLGYLLFMVSLAGVGALDEPGSSWLVLARDAAAITASFALAGLVLFGRTHARAVYRDHIQRSAPGSLADVQPEVFLAQAQEGDALVGCLVTKQASKPLWLPLQAGTTSDVVPCAYLLLRRANEALAVLFNPGTGVAYTWFDESPLLRLHGDAWAREYYRQCKNLGVLDQLQWVVQSLQTPATLATAAGKPTSALRERAALHRQMTCRCGKRMRLPAAPSREPYKCGACAASFLATIVDGVLQVSWLPEPPTPEAASTMSVAQARGILGVDASADDDALKRAWRRAVQQCHPDRYAQLPERMQKLAALEAQRVNDAYLLLTRKA